jgi:hypothetical protein
MKYLLSLLSLACIACNELPLGQDELYGRGDFAAQEIELVRINTLTVTDPYACLGTSRNIVVGAQDGYQSRILIRFSFPDTTFEGLDEIKLILQHNSDFQNDEITFTVHLLNEAFEEAEANWLQRTTVEYWQAEGGDYNATPIVTSQAGDDSTIIYFNYTQLQAIEASDGIILIPQDSGFVYFRSKESGYDPEIVLVKNEESYTIVTDADCHIVTGTAPPELESWIGSGLPYRNYAKFEFIPALDDTAEIKAVYGDLTFLLDEQFAWQDSIEIGVRELLEPLDDFHTETGSRIALRKHGIGDTMFSIDIVSHIQRIIDFPDSNFGFFIEISPQDYDIAHLKIRSGSHRLVAGYIPPPSERFE